MLSKEKRLLISLKNFLANIQFTNEFGLTGIFPNSKVLTGTSHSFHLDSSPETSKEWCSYISGAHSHEFCWSTVFHRVDPPFICCSWFCWWWWFFCFCLSVCFETGSCYIAVAGLEFCRPGWPEICVSSASGGDTVLWLRCVSYAPSFTCSLDWICSYCMWINKMGTELNYSLGK